MILNFTIDMYKVNMYITLKFFSISRFEGNGEQANSSVVGPLGGVSATRVQELLDVGFHISFLCCSFI